MIGDNYECDGQMNISDVLGEHPEENFLTREEAKSALAEKGGAE